MRKMKRRLGFSLVMLILGIMISQAQNDRPIEERIEAQRIAFITQRLSLSPQEAQVFWPVYNEYRDKERKLKESRSTREDIAEMSESECADYLGKMLDLEQHELDLKRQYTEKLKTVISTKKIVRLYTAERMFKERLLQAMNQRKGNFRD